MGRWTNFRAVGWLQVAAAATLLTACAGRPSAVPLPGPQTLDALAGSRWEWRGALGAGAGLQALPDLQFVSLTQVNGLAGCNRFAGPARVAGDGLQFGPLAATRRMCEGSQMQAEDRYLRALAATRRARVEFDQLVLQGADGAELIRLYRLP